MSAMYVNQRPSEDVRDHQIEGHHLGDQRVSGAISDDQRALTRVPGPDAVDEGIILCDLNRDRVNVRRQRISLQSARPA